MFHYNVSKWAKDFDSENFLIQEKNFSWSSFGLKNFLYKNDIAHNLLLTYYQYFNKNAVYLKPNFFRSNIKSLILPFLNNAIHSPHSYCRQLSWAIFRHTCGLGKHLENTQKYGNEVNTCTLIWVTRQQLKLIKNMKSTWSCFRMDCHDTDHWTYKLLAESDPVSVLHIWNHTGVMSLWITTSTTFFNSVTCI